ncbi:MAG TPA: PhnD/SsuA/transferrin family substrate-binding protein [Xanthobacteraceae bacterium]|jgi:4,5-dihydroxyphthalate decarboxylase
MTEQPRLKIAIATYGHTKDIKSGAVAIAGVEPDFVEVVPIIGAFRRMVRGLEFDVCEMAPTTYMIARALGAPFIALPIFLMRRFHHGGFVVRPDSGIKEPKDLEGRKVGVRAYSVSTGVWTRGIFVNEYGLDSSKVTWVVDDEEHVTSLKLPPNVVHAPDGKSLASMMASGELQAAFSGPAGIGRAGPPTGAWEQRAQTSSVSYPELIPNAPEVEAQWFRRTGIYPIHGLIVVKTAVLAQHPFVARSLLDAFLTAKDAYVARLKAGEGEAPDDVKYRNLMALVGDPLPYGMKENMPSIEAMLTYGLQQGLIPKRMPMEDVFVDPQRQ